MSFTESIDELVAADASGLLAVHPTWERVRLVDVCAVLNGFPFPSNRFRPSGGTPLIRIRDVVRGRTETHFVGDFDASFIVRRGELIVGMDGDFNCARWSDGDALLNQRVCKLTPDERFYDRRLLAHALPGYLSAINSKTSAITVKHLSSRTIAEIPLPLPPRKEQARLVEAIESYLTRLDDAAATLERVQHNLTRYRASVLNAAVDGRLVPTEAELARAEGRGYEPASVLLDRILAERRRRWEEAELAKIKAKGKAPKDDEWKAKYVAPVAPDESELPELPDGWCWATVDALSWDGGYGVSRKCQPDGSGPPVLRIPNVQDEILTFDDLKFATGEEGLSPDGVLVPGDFVFIRSNGSKSLIGRGALVVTSLARDYHFASYLIRLRLATSLTTARWFALAWHVPVVRDQILRDAASSAGQHNVRLSAARRYVVPLPPHAEQERLLAEVERLLSIGDSARGLVRPSISRSARVRQSILKWAFEGRLVDQDSSDEPASVLLERIRAERAAATDQPPRRARRENARAPKR